MSKPSVRRLVAALALAVGFTVVGVTAVDASASTLSGTSRPTHPRPADFQW